MDRQRETKTVLKTRNGMKAKSYKQKLRMYDTQRETR